MEPKKRGNSPTPEANVLNRQRLRGVENPYQDRTERDFNYDDVHDHPTVAVRKKKITPYTFYLF